MDQGELEKLRSEIILAIEPYTRVSSLHNFGPGGLSRVEKAKIETGTFILEDVTYVLDRFIPEPTNA